MGKSVEDEDYYRACAECARVCHTTHGRGRPRSVPRFTRPVPDYALPDANGCNMQIPASYLREHVDKMKGKCCLVGVTGAQWGVTLKDIAFKGGWKEFAMDYKLEKGDILMFALVAPKRFYVDVFDKFGMEKLSTKGPVINKTPEPNPQNGNHDRQLSRKRPLTEMDHSSHQPVENHEAESFSLNESSDDSEPVRLAKSVLRKSKQKKLLKKRKMSCTSSLQIEGVAEVAKSEGAEEPELRKNLQNEDGAMEVKSIEDRVNKGVAILSRYVDLAAGGPRVDDNETMFEKPCEEDPIVGASNDADVSHGPQDPVPVQPEEAVGPKITPADQRQDDAETVRGGATGEDPVLKGSEITQVGELQPNHVFQPGLVKQEPESLRVATSYPQHACKTCKNCGRPKKEKTPMKLRELKLEPVTSENLETPEARSPSSNAPSSSTGRVTEDQKQRALVAAKELSATTTNRHAIVVMRVGFNKTTYDCFVSLKCAEMLPSEAAELTLLDSKGVSCIVNWNADLRYLQGPGWRDFVDSHNLQLNDVFVLEVLENSEQRCVVLVHVFHAREMENSPVQPSPRVASCVQASPAAPSNLLHGFSPLSTKAPNVDEVELPGSLAPPHDATRELPEPSTTRNPRRTSSSSLSTPGKTRAAAVTPPSSSMKASALNAAEAVVRTEPPRPPPVASTAEAAESPGPSMMMRPTMVSSSPLTPATVSLASVPTGDEPPRDVVHESFRNTVNGEQVKLGGRSKQKSVRDRHKLYTPHLRKKEDVKTSKATMQMQQQYQQQQRSTDGSEKQVRTRNSRKVRYPVAKLLERRKFVHGNVLFLVELGKPVSQSVIHKKMKCKQDNKGRWWVPHHHFTKDFTSCFIE